MARWLRGASRRPRYVGIGHRPTALYPMLSYLTGRREALERLVMRLPARLLARPEPWSGAGACVYRALADLPEPRSALLLYTGYYKATTFVGPVVLRGEEGRLVFWKAFP